jgi:hypothetical protein
MRLGTYVLSKRYKKMLKINGKFTFMTATNPINDIRPEYYLRLFVRKVYKMRCNHVSKWLKHRIPVDYNCVCL